MYIRAVLFTLCLVIMHAAAGQTDFKQSYVNGKALFKEGKYNLAMEAFKEAIQYDNNNPYSEYASFFYALAAYKKGYLSVSKDMFVQIKSLYPKWDKLSEVNFWIGKILMDSHEYFQALKIWSGIQDPLLQSDIKNWKQVYLSEIKDAETLRMMNEEYPKDQEVIKALAKELSLHQTEVQPRKELESLIQKYNLDKNKYLTETPSTYFKEVYTVSLFYPFLTKSLEPTMKVKRNQIVLDFYEGMKMANEDLNAKGIKVELRAYDTERKVSTVKKLLATEEVKNTDVIVGPFFPEMNGPIQEFSKERRINVLNPFSNNIDLIKGNEFGFLTQPSYETIGSKSAQFLAEYRKGRKQGFVYSGITHRDSLIVGAFIKKSKELGLNILNVRLLPKEQIEEIIDVLVTPTELDEWNVPVDFTLAKDSIDFIFVPSEDALIYSKVMSAVETRKDKITVLGMESWVDQNALDYAKFQHLDIVLGSPNFVSVNTTKYKDFAKTYLRQNGKYPSIFARRGYETMMFLGQALKNHGVYFQEAFKKMDHFPGYFSEGYNFQSSHDNQRIPFAKFEEGEMKVIAIK